MDDPWGAALARPCMYMSDPYYGKRYLAYVHSGYGLYGLIPLYTHIPTYPPQPISWVGSYISRARMRPHVNTRTRIMRARGRAHAPARGGKPLDRSRNRWFVEDRSRTGHIQGIAVHSPYRPIPVYTRIQG